MDGCSGLRRLDLAVHQLRSDQLASPHIRGFVSAASFYRRCSHVCNEPAGAGHSGPPGHWEIWEAGRTFTLFPAKPPTARTDGSGFACGCDPHNAIRSQPVAAPISFCHFRMAAGPIVAWSFSVPTHLQCRIGKVTVPDEDRPRSSMA